MNDLTISNVDYLETILILGGNKNGVKSVDVAKVMNVSKPAVTTATTSLLERGYIKKISYGDIRLTQTGYDVAKKIMEKRRFIELFLTKIGVSPEVAMQECYNMKHYLCDETYLCLKEFCIQHNIIFEGDITTFNDTCR